MKNIIFPALLIVLWLLPPLPVAPAKAQEQVLTLNQCLDIAFKNNLDMAQARENRNAAEFNMMQSQGLRYPEVGVGATAAYLSEQNQIRLDDTFIPDPAGPGAMIIPGRRVLIGEREKADLYLALTQPLYTGGKIEGRIRAAEAGFNESLHRQELARSQVRLDVIRAFYGLTAAMESLEIALASRRQIESHLSDATNLMDQGMLLKSELLPIEIRRLDIELMIVRAENAMARAKAALAERMGLAPESEIAIRIENDGLPPWPVPEDLLSDAVLRPEQKIVEQQIAGAKSTLDIAAGNLLPDIGLTLSGHYGWPGFAATDPDWEPWWQAGLSLSWNIFDMDQRKNERNAAQARLARTGLAAKSVERKISLDRINTRLAYGEACRQMAIALEKVAAAEENFRIREDNFKVGMATNTEYLDAHTELMNAKSHFSVLSAEVRIAWADFLRAEGKETWTANTQNTP